MNRKLLATAAIISMVIALGGCASRATTQADFGNAVREVTINQTHDIGATLDSEPEAVVGADPYVLENVINAHRERSSESRGAGHRNRMFR